MKKNNLIIIVNFLLIFVVYVIFSIQENNLPNQITGYAIISENESIYDNNYEFFSPGFSQFEFNARFSDNIINHDSWHISGFGDSAVFDNLDKAVFYVDVGIITPYLQVNNIKYWCKSIIKDWTVFHLFKIVINTKTSFYIDNESICEFDKMPKSSLPIFIGEHDKSRPLKMYVTNINYS